MKSLPVRKPSIPSVPQEMLRLAKALEIAVSQHFMAPEHAGQIWKQLLKNSGLDTVRKTQTEKVVTDK